MGVKVYYWKHTNENWGHASLSLSNGTHISWWPSRQIDDHKKIPGDAGTAIAAITESVPPIKDMTLTRDIENEGARPTEVIELQSGSLDEEKIKNWWNSFKTANSYNGMRLNCATVVWMALKEGGCLQWVKDPGNWWWDPNAILKVTKAIEEGIKKKHPVPVSLPGPPANTRNPPGGRDEL